MTNNNALGNPTVPDLKLITQHLLDEGTISKKELVRLVKDVTELLSKSLGVILC